MIYSVKDWNDFTPYSLYIGLNLKNILIDYNLLSLQEFENAEKYIKTKHYYPSYKETMDQTGMLNQYFHIKFTCITPKVNFNHFEKNYQTNLNTGFSDSNFFKSIFKIHKKFYINFGIGDYQEERFLKYEEHTNEGFLIFLDQNKEEEIILGTIPYSMLLPYYQDTNKLSRKDLSKYSDKRKSDLDKFQWDYSLWGDSDFGNNVPFIKNKYIAIQFNEV